MKIDRGLTGVFGLTLAMLVSSVALAGQPPAPPEGWTDSYAMVNGIRMHYWRTGGDKPVLILSHGGSDDGLCWTNLAKELADDYDIIMPDARAHGLSDPMSKTDPPDVQAEDLAALIRELNIEKPIVMGHSMGASASAWFAAKYPDVPRAVVLEDPRLLPRTGGDEEPSVEEAMARILKRNQTSYDDLVAGCNPKWGLEECRIWAPSKRRYHPSNAYRRRGERPATSELLAKISVPTLIIKADADAETREKEKEVASILAHGEIVHIDGAGHNVRREQKQALLDALKAFLAKLVGPA